MGAKRGVLLRYEPHQEIQSSNLLPATAFADDPCMVIDKRFELRVMSFPVTRCMHRCIDDTGKSPVYRVDDCLFNKFFFGR